jgi:hypothetical protein
MAKGKSTEGQTTIYKTYTYSLRSSNMNPTKNREWNQVLRGMVSSSCSTSGTRRVNLVRNPVIRHERRRDREVELWYNNVLQQKACHLKM